MFMKKKYITLFFVTLISISSCDVSYLDNNIEEDINIDFEAQFPLGNLSYSVNEILDELDANSLEEISSDELKFSFKDSISLSEDIVLDFKLNDEKLASTIPNPITESDIFPFEFPLDLTYVPAELNQKKINHQLVYHLNWNQKLTTIYFSAGNMKIKFNSSFDAEISFALEIPSIINKESGIAFSKSFIMNGDSTSILNLNLDDYYINLTHDGMALNSTTNSLVINLRADFFFSVGNVLKSDDAISYDISFSNTEAALVHGDFKQESFSIPTKTIPLNFLDIYGDSNISFSNPRISISAVSDYGFPVGVDLSEIKAVKNSESKNLSYAGDNSLANFLIVEGIENYGDPKKSTKRVLTTENSNISQILVEKTDELQVDLTAIVNPINNNPNQNFYTYPNEGLNVELAIDFEAVSLTKKVAYSIDENLQDLTKMELFISVQNEIPLSGDIFLNFKNNSNQTVHSEILNVFQAANVTESGESDGIAKLSKFNISLDKNEIQNILNATSVDVKLTITLPTGEDRVLLNGSDKISIYISSIIGGKTQK